MKRIQVAAVTAVLALGGASFCHGQDAGRDAAVMKHEELVKRLEVKVPIRITGRASLDVVAVPS